MRFTRLRDTCRSENQVTRFASDSLIFFRPARCSVGSPPEARGDERRSVRGEIPHCVRNDKGTSKSIFIQAFSPPPRGLPCFFPNASFHCALG
ncbi:hypothetical protein [Tannerella forsythia]|uniref:hypothetical protein n=1 Tax=Tannerella forsythia TaxID=28112 RepID=UPI0015CEF66C|nr:hypothetical protein [Tannerella forsythia]